MLCKTEGKEEIVQRSPSSTIELIANTLKKLRNLNVR